MGKVFDGIDEKLAAWIGRQRMFFVGTAPSGDGGHVNISPKGPIESLRILGPCEVAYQDIIGSGAETIAHLRENGRIVVMFCSFDGPPRILRLHGHGTVLPVDAVEFPGTEVRPDARRAVIRVDVERIADSCGYGVPLMDYAGERPHSDLSSGKRLRVHGPDAFRDYQAEKNLVSIDGLPAVELG